MRIELDVSDKNEYTAEPWWLIIDPQQNFNKGEQGIYNIANMITGPFFSREEGEKVLKARSHHYSKHAVVFCHSGCNSIQYYNAYREAENKLTEIRND